jgi:hypothetical protein
MMVQIINLLFNKRNISLLPFMQDIETTLDSKLLPLEEEEEPGHTQNMEHFLNIMDLWSAIALKEEKDRIPGFRKMYQKLRHMQTASKTLRKSIENMDDPDFVLVY